MKRILSCFLSFLIYSISFAMPQTDTLIDKLNEVIKQASVYDKSKLEEINKLKQLLQSTSVNNLNNEYEIDLKLYEEYKYYNYDSAFLYASKLQVEALKKKDYSILADAKLKGIFIVLSGGMYKETLDSLNGVSLHNVTNNVKAEYYTLIGLTYFSLADYNGDLRSSAYYNNKANLYIDSSLIYYPQNSFEHLYFSALNFLKKGNNDSALYNLNRLLLRKNLTLHQIALATSTMGGIYISQKHEDMAKPYLVRASLADIKSSTKETLALLILASIMYKEGKIEEAALYIEKANADATFYNARLRKVQVGAILPLIEGGMINTIRKQKEKLQVFLIALSILALLLAGFAIIIRNQVKKLKIARQNLVRANVKQQQINQELSEANELKEKFNSQLTEINKKLVEANEIKERYNSQLQEINHQLSEANKIKEEYIGYYFNLDNEYLARIEKLITTLDKKLLERKWEEIKYILKSVDPKKERDELLKNFDKVFLRLFPNFVSQFNSLFKEEDKIILKDDQLLTPELRIFALIRLGITENEKIAEILDYTINTIYAKKTKVRSKTIVKKEEFERKVAEITTITS